METERGGRAEATMSGNLLDRQIRAFKQALRLHDALLEQPLIGSGAKGGTEAAGKGSRAHPGSPRHLLHRQILLQMMNHPR